MKPQLAMLEESTRSGEERGVWRCGLTCRLGVLFCVLLVFLTSFVAVVHVHPNDSGRVERSCSLCALAHAGVAVNVVAQPAPIFASSVRPEIPAIVWHSYPFVSSNYIRPPPQA
ncbi:MAG TPA: hypothetical protein VHQ22_00285 [Terriglobales bacterium]|nr:hypothetical protein [Terriglobales bacterium]